MDVQRLMALGHAKKFVEIVSKHEFTDPVGIMDIIGKEVRQLMLTTWSPGTRTQTIARLTERIAPLAHKTGRP